MSMAAGGAERTHGPGWRRSPIVERVLEASIGASLALGFALLKLSYRAPLGDGLDGSYYLQIARHVAQGEGFSTSVSLYHMGLEPLPQPAMTYPLLPVVLGLVARRTGIETAARAVPVAFYFGSLVLAYAWIRTVALGVAPGRTRLAVFAATTLTALLGLNPIYHWASSRPYTESLAFTLVLATLVAFTSAKKRRFSRPVRADAAYFGIGLLAGFCYLARFQLLVAAPALAGVEMIGLSERRFRRAGWLLGGAALCVVPWAVRFFRMPGAELRPLFDFAAYHPWPLLPRLDYSVPCAGPFACVLDKLGGLVHAFTPALPTSYVAQFGAATLALPAAAAAMALGARRRRSFGALRRARYAPLVASGLLGTLAVAPLHLLHSQRWSEWAFGWRQGLPLFFVLVPACLVLVTSARRWRGVRPRDVLARCGLAVVVAAAVMHALLTLGRKTVELGFDPAIAIELEGVRGAAAYLTQHAAHERTLGIEPQPLAAFTDAPLDWLACWSPPELAERLVTGRHATRAVLRPGELACPSLARIRPWLALEYRVETPLPVGVFRIARP
ncbi:MAG TPA: hypothetical protein VGQ57_15535 [Polyangiaceae bacterium]|nr:hypothetical protein [Polyangiaceae bacterium]